MPAARLPHAADPSGVLRLERGGRLGLCAALSALLHLLLLSLCSQPGAPGLPGVRLQASLSRPAGLSPELASAVVLPPRDAPAAPLLAPSPPLALPETPVAQEAAPARLPGGAGGKVPDDYLPVEALTTRPRFLVDMREYIPASLDATEAGEVVVQILIAANGEVDGVVIERSDLSPRGTRRFIQRLDALQLAPGLLDGRPVKARWRLEFSFAPLS